MHICVGCVPSCAGIVGGRRACWIIGPTGRSQPHALRRRQVWLLLSEARQLSPQMRSVCFLGCSGLASCGFRPSPNGRLHCILQKLRGHVHIKCYLARQNNAAVYTVVPRIQFNLQRRLACRAYNLKPLGRCHVQEPIDRLHKQCTSCTLLSDLPETQESMHANCETHGHIANCETHGQPIACWQHYFLLLLRLERAAPSASACQLVRKAASQPAMEIHRCTAVREILPNRQRRAAACKSSGPECGLWMRCGRDSPGQIGTRVVSRIVFGAQTKTTRTRPTQFLHFTFAVSGGW